MNKDVDKKRKRKTFKSRFISKLKVEVLEDPPRGRKVKLINDFIFYDKAGRSWRAPRGSIVDGASIPRILWRATGSPYVGLYRRASVIHDVYCENKKRSSRDTHRVFYEAMRVDGVPKKKALRMYWAVKTFGPKW